MRWHCDHDGIDRAEFKGEFRLRLARLPGGDGSPILFLVGGPGASALEWLSHPPFRMAFEAMREAGDVVLLDQRGCGSSDPRLEMPALQWSPDAFLDRQSAVDMFRKATHEALASWDTHVARRIHPWASAADVVAIADALGGVRLWAHSYGTHLAMAAIKADPFKFDSTILLGFEGPDDTWKLPSRVQHVLERWDAVLPDGLFERFQRCCDILNLEPISVPFAPTGEARLGAFGLRWIVATWCGLSQLMRRLPHLLRSIEMRDCDALTGYLQKFARAQEKPAAFWLCDAASGVTEDRRARILAESPGCILQDLCNFPWIDIYSEWRSFDLGDDFRTSVANGPPTMVFTGSLDAFTPTENLEGQWAGVHHAEVLYAAHDDLLTHPDVLEDSVEFLRGRPPRHARYEASLPDWVT